MVLTILINITNINDKINVFIAIVGRDDDDDDEIDVQLLFESLPRL